MNKEQLTDAEKRGPYGCECGHSLGSHKDDVTCKICECPRFIGGLDTSALQVALADARLELQEVKDSRDGFACDLDAAQAEVARIQASSEAWMVEARRLEAEVARLTEERDGAVDRGVWLWTYSWKRHLFMLGAEVLRTDAVERERDRQREDIRRLMGALVHALQCRLLKCHACQEAWGVRIEMKGRYGA